MESAAIKIDPEIQAGMPCFAGTRVPVRSLFDYLDGDYSISEFLEQFPSVTRDQVDAVLRTGFAAIRSSAMPASVR